MKFVYATVRNMLLFFFLSALFAGIMFVGDGEFLDYLWVGLLFGAVMAAAPNILVFMKVRENIGVLFLILIVLSFIYFFLGSYIFEFLEISSGRVALNSATTVLTVEDKTFGLIIISLFSALLNVILELLERQK
jgi:hypothetical protein